MGNTLSAMIIVMPKQTFYRGPEQFSGLGAEQLKEFKRRQKNRPVASRRVGPDVAQASPVTSHGLR